MDSVTHAAVGFSIAGPWGAAAAVAVDVPAFIGLLLTDRIHARRRGDGFVFDPPRHAQPFFAVSTVAHSAWIMPLALLGPVGMAAVSHAVLDWMVHEKTALLPPFKVDVVSGLRWTKDFWWRLVVWGFLAVVGISRF